MRCQRRWLAGCCSTVLVAVEAPTAGHQPVGRRSPATPSRRRGLPQRAIRHYGEPASGSSSWCRSPLSGPVVPSSPPALLMTGHGVTSGWPYAAAGSRELLGRRDLTTVPSRLSAGDDGQDDRGRVPGVVVDNLVGDDGCVSTVQGLAGAGIGRTVRVVARRDLHPDAMATSEEVARRGQLNAVGVDHTWGNQRRGGN